ncbi:MAG: SDR family NAD(P)-dependent oxidoreductase [bacterium]
MKIILLTGSTDGIGLCAAKKLAKGNYLLLLHGRTNEKLEKTKSILEEINPDVDIKLFPADLSDLSQIKELTESILSSGIKIDVIINNAGINVVSEKDVITSDNLDIRIVVNTIAPYIITNNLLKILNEDSRVVNVASAAQMPVDIDFLNNKYSLSHSEAYAVSKLALIMWNIELSKLNKSNFIAVNPKSYLGSKMVKVAYNIEGYDLQIGADILLEAALSEKFKYANGKYYDNDYQEFGNVHPFANNQENRKKLMTFLNKYL